MPLPCNQEQSPLAHLVVCCIIPGAESFVQTCSGVCAGLSSWLLLKMSPFGLAWTTRQWPCHHES
ncbi:hypothetical protein JMJ77_0005234 [Colletotrichum scovillei]|uniref:Uncharacterized protein n=1 Tax=Colletotrichum scovillei TaxID=1209932 RepID=A0A9P7UIJ8_9PEZI|nr:hypothetical protein JMJ77_0005234 [Colletotrichum scovillei]KAG7076448.1 hypothetical protein JMJ76_0013713 [Colletotrichum scovillei]KAG7083531.1 hypothetical protein JMJ78_0008976 [Colletotrichum scovillei]